MMCLNLIIRPIYLPNLNVSIVTGKVMFPHANCLTFSYVPPTSFCVYMPVRMLKNESRK